jgi:hypothetical protein
MHELGADAERAETIVAAIESEHPPCNLTGYIAALAKRAGW